MKKIFAMVLVGLMILTFAGSVFAAGLGEDLSVMSMEQTTENKGIRFNALKEFKDEIHQINSLRIEKLDLRTQVIEKQDQLLDLYIEARENADREALKEARDIKQQIKAVNEEMKSLYQQVKEERTAFKEDVKNGDLDAAEEHIDSVISLLELVNGKIQEKIELLDDIMDVLS